MAGWLVFSGEFPNLPKLRQKVMDNERRFYTYAYLREDGTPYYIGKGTGRRIDNASGKSVKLPPKDRRIFLKENLTEEEAFKHEIYLIAIYGRKDLGTGILWNFTDGGDGTSGFRPTEVTRRKLSEASKGNTRLLGHRHSDEAKRRISEKSKGKRHSDETKRKISEKLKGKQNCLGRKLSEDTKRKMSEAQRGEKHYLYGKSMPEESRRKISESISKTIWVTDGLNNLRLHFEEKIPDGWWRGRTIKKKVR
jgi:hypothetical protein